MHRVDATADLGEHIGSSRMEPTTSSTSLLRRGSRAIPVDRSSRTTTRPIGGCPEELGTGWHR